MAGSVNVIFYDNRFGAVDTSSGAYSQISTLPLSASAGIAGGFNTLYVEDLNSSLLSVDPVTGAARLVGNSALNLTAIVFGGGSNGLFEIDSASNLYSISPSTGHATLIGATGLPGNLQQYDTSLSSDGDFLLFTAGRPGADDELYSVDTRTGRADDLGNTGVTGVAGSAFVGGDLFLFQYGATDNYIYSAPDGSTFFSEVGPLGVQVVDGGATPVVSSSQTQSQTVPEPGTLASCMAGVSLAWLAWGGASAPWRCSGRGGAKLGFSRPARAFTRITACQARRPTGVSAPQGISSC